MYEGILKDSKKQYIVSAHFPIWTFVWHWGSAEDSEEEYGLIRTDEQGIQKAIARLEEGNSNNSGDGIIYGREVDIGKTNILLERLQSKNKQKKVTAFLKLSPEEQKKKLEELL